MEFCTALALSGIAFLVGGLSASIANPTGGYLGFYLPGCFWSCFPLPGSARSRSLEA